VRSIVRRATATSAMIALVLLGVTSPASATPQVRASGAFSATVDFASLVATPVGKSSCRFRVEGTLTFTGTLTGAADGGTTALVHAPCDQALSSPPGTFADVFRFEGSFTGTAAGVPVVGADLAYAGVTRAGGGIDASIRVRAEGVQATLRTTDAVVGVGGTYDGVVVPRG
jgi:hypothetical protein